MAGSARLRKSIRQSLNLDYLPAVTRSRVLALLLISGFLINIYVAATTSLWHDEAITANAAISFLQNGIPNFPSGYQYWRSFPHTLLVAASGYLFGVTDLTLRLPSILLSALTVTLTYFVGKEFFDKDVGLIGSAILTFSALQVAWATQVRMYALFQFLYLLAVLLIYRSVELKRKKDLFLLATTLLVIGLVHITSQVLYFVAIAYWLYRTDLSYNYDRLTSIGIPVLVLTAAIILELFSSLSFLNTLSRLTFAPENIRYYYVLVFQHIPSLLTLGVAGSLLAFRKNLKTAVLTGLSVFPALYIYIIHVDGVSGRYILFSLPFLALWSGITIKSLSEKAIELIANQTNSNMSFKSFAVFITLVALIAGSGFDYNFSEGDYRFNIDEKSVYNYIENHTKENDVLITQWTPSATYYYRPPDYSLYGDEYHSGYNSSNYREDYSFNGTDVYSGAEFIDNNTELEQVINSNELGWVVLRDESYRRKSDEIKQTLSKLSSIGEFRGLNVWKWNKSASNHD